MLLRKERCYSEVYNDLWGTVVNVFQVLRNPEQACRLKQMLELTPYSRHEFESCGEIDIASIEDPVERARRTILRSFAGFGSASTNARYTTGFRANSDRSGTTPAGDWRNYPSHIPEFIERLRGVVIESRPAIEVILQHDRDDAVIYCDPPYVHSTRNMRGNAAYECEMSEDDHAELAQVLRDARGVVIISGYRSDLYRDLYSGWHCIERKALADGARERTECLWLNQVAAAVRPQPGIFDQVTSRSGLKYISPQ